MYKVHYLNKISEKGTALWSQDYILGATLEEADGILVRSASMHDMQLPKSDFGVKVHMISSNAVLSKICELSGCDIEIADDGEDVIFAVLDEGRLLAYAGMNDVEYEDNSVEISVETAPEHRRLGYGSACVSALTKHLTDKGMTVRYKCSRDNTNSSALAEKCGFKLEGERFSFVCERI